MSPDPTLRISGNNSDWPPAILFDAVYAGAVLHYFGTQALKDEVSRGWEDALYPGGIATVPHADYADEGARERSRKRAQARLDDDEARKRDSPDTFDMLMALPYIRVPPGAMREAREKAEAAERERLRERVDTWMKGVSDE